MVELLVVKILSSPRKQLFYSDGMWEKQDMYIISCTQACVVNIVHFLYCAIKCVSI